MINTKMLFLIQILFSISVSVCGHEIYVSPKGNDKAAGTKAQTLATFAATQHKVRFGKDTTVLQ